MGAPMRPFQMIARLLSGMLAAATQSALAARAQDWVTYRDAKYGFSLQYPADIFAVERTSESGDGQIFVSQGGSTRLLVGTFVNDLHYSPTNYLNYLAQHSYGEYRIEYKRAGRSWFVLSGQGGGKVFYEKVMFSCDGRLINGLVRHQRM